MIFHLVFLVQTDAASAGVPTSMVIYMGTYRVHSAAKQSPKCISASYQRIAISESRIAQSCLMEICNEALVFKSSKQKLMSHPLESIRVISAIPQLGRGFGYVNDVEDKSFCHLFELGSGPESEPSVARWIAAIETQVAKFNTGSLRPDAKNSPATPQVCIIVRPLKVMS